ncbi:uncharacterized protein LOC144114697 isoform X2 [Amblyomma americanum]
MFTLHRFPTSPALRQQYIAAVNRKNFDATEASRVCSRHFVGGKKTEENVVPMLDMGYEKKVVVGRRLVRQTYTPQPKKIRRSTGAKTGLCSDAGQITDVGAQACPDLSMSDDKDTDTPLEEYEACLAPDDMVEEPKSDQVATAVVVPDMAEEAILDQVLIPTMATAETAEEMTEDELTPAVEQSPEVRTASTQWEDQNNEHSYCQRGLGTLSDKQQLSAATLGEDDCVFYTGLGKTHFQNLVTAVKVELRKLFTVLPYEDHLLLTLMRLRLGLLYGHLARIFQISVGSVCNIFRHVLSVLCTIMEKVVTWLPRSITRNSMPKSFIDNGYDTTTCIVDCSEINLQRPKKLMPRAQTYSSYKAHNTVKFLIAIAPDGYIMYVSPAYGGRASDKYITKDCKLEDHLGPGDEVMADRGFTLTTSMIIQGVKLNVPAFTKGKSQLVKRKSPGREG